MDCIYVAKKGTSGGIIYLFMVFLTWLSVGKFIVVQYMVGLEHR